MGFRSLRDFNLTLLVKQGWRLLSNLDSLVGSIFRVRYYPNGNFLQAGLGSYHSFIWRSIVEAQSVVRMGARCRVGNGSKINIINDPWLPCIANPRVTTVCPALNHQKVTSLMMSEALAWEEDLVHDVFNNRDAQLILSIPLNSSRIVDKWYWEFEKSGLFSVKSAYRKIRDLKEVELQGSDTVLWKRLWKVRAPPKAKDMVWRAATSCLPTKTQLRVKCVNIDAICPLCSNDRESIPHVLVGCSFAKACWDRTGIGVSTVVRGSFLGWLEQELCKLEEGQRATFVMTCWAIWRVRNDFIWNGKGASVAGVGVLAHNSLVQWQEAQDKCYVPSRAFTTEADGTQVWIRPEPGVIKINVDAAIFADLGAYSYVCMARDSAGTVLEVKSCCRAGAGAVEPRWQRL